MITGRGRAALILVIVAVCGGLAGAAVERLVVQRYFHHPQGRPSAEQLAEHRKQMLDDMTKVLDLTAAQRLGIDSIMQHTDSALRAIRHEMQPRTIAEFESSRNAIIARLDSAQRVKFAKIPKRTPPGRR
jgi:hypothetical protein